MTGSDGAAGAGFESSRQYFDETVVFLEGEQASGWEHGKLEDHLEQRSRELCRRLLADHLDLRAQREQRLERVSDAAGVARRSVESGTRSGPGHGLRRGDRRALCVPPPRS